ncbi:hypothetical protein ARMSODRAFT_972744 [Armillaria solidipes]|uniref:Uncharacterized protein n=1 Tax=Armillaria solidipes TaxID=1076256 RepID=A0A2H3BMC4_9AGAR|nr:hypothetical protein ARMSODRAFT_972744 [Armillaria solidipes]
MSIRAMYGAWTRKESLGVTKERGNFSGFDSFWLSALRTITTVQQREFSVELSGFMGQLISTFTVLPPLPNQFSPTASSRVLTSCRALLCELCLRRKLPLVPNTLPVIATATTPMSNLSTTPLPRTLWSLAQAVALPVQNEESCDNISAIKTAAIVGESGYYRAGFAVDLVGQGASLA